MTDPQVAPQAAFHKELVAMTPQFAQVVPEQLSADRLARTVRNAVQANPKLLQADRKSFWNAAMSAAVFGLEVDPAIGQGALVPFKGKVQFIPMYPGLVKLAYNAGWLIEGHVVRHADEFDFRYGSDQFCHHKPAMGMGTGTENPIIAAYAFARHVTEANAPVALEVMDLVAVIAIRDRTSGWKAYKDKGYDTQWNVDFAGMARKTPIRGLAHHLPLEVQRAVRMESRHDRTGDIVNVTRDPSTGDLDTTSEKTIDGEATEVEG